MSKKKQKLKFLLVSYAALLPCLVFSQFGRGSEWHAYAMPDNIKVQHSRVWKMTGLAMIGTGLYLARTQDLPQRIDVPIITVGVLLTIEGIRLRNSVNYSRSRRRDFIFN